MEESKNVDFAKMMDERKKKLTSIFEALKKKDADFNLVPHQDELSEILDFLERRKNTFQELDSLLCIKNEFKGFLDFAKNLNDPNWKLEEKEDDFNGFYQKVLKDVNNLKIIATDDDLDKFIGKGEKLKEAMKNQKELYEKQILENNDLNQQIRNLSKDNKEFLEKMKVPEQKMKDLSDEIKNIKEKPQTIEKESQEIEILKKELENSLKNTEKLTYENKQIKDNLQKYESEIENLKKIPEEKSKQNKENMMISMNDLQQVNGELLDKFQMKLLQDKLQQQKKKLQETFAKEKLQFEQKNKENLERINDNLEQINGNLEKIKSLEKENSELKNRNFSQNEVFRKSGETLIKMSEFHLKKIKQNQANSEQKLSIALEKCKKIKAKFLIYRKYFGKYQLFFHDSTLITIMKDFTINHLGYSDMKLLHEKLEPFTKAQIEIVLPEENKFIDRQSIEKKIDVMLNNIMKLNQFAKIFYKIMEKFHPNPNSRDSSTHRIDKGFEEIYEVLQKLDENMSHEYISINDKYNEIALDGFLPKKNLVEIFERCFRLESDCINKILNLESFYYYFFDL